MACLTAGVPALAQDSSQANQPPSSEVIGPPQLSNFSLNGTVTRAAPEPVPVRKQTPPSVTEPAQTTAATDRQPSRKAPTAKTTSAPVRTEVTEASTAPSPTLSQPSRVSAPVTAVPSTSDTAPDPAASLAPTEPADAGSGASSQGALALLPWIVAAVAAAAAALWFFFFRQRPRESYAGISNFDLTSPQQPAPAAPLRAPAPAAPKAPAPSTVPPPPAAGGVVSTRLRPWLEIEFKPDRAVVDDTRAAVAFEVSVLNSGSVPARDVLLEASLFNAGAVQDQQIQLFFDNPVAKGDRIPVIPPMQRVTVNTAVFLARDQVRPIEIEGRPLFVPIIGFNALYSWGRSNGQTSASYLVGKETTGEKLAPFRLDLGPRIFRGLGAREHELRVRK
jgi:hypothetical protein